MRNFFIKHLNVTSTPPKTNMLQQNYASLALENNGKPPNCWGSKTYSFLGCISWDVVSQDRIKIFLPDFDPNPHVNVTSIHILYWGSTSSLCLKFAFHSTNGRPWHAAMWPISPPAAHSLGNPGAKSHTHSKIGAKKVEPRHKLFPTKMVVFFPMLLGFYTAAMSM